MRGNLLCVVSKVVLRMIDSALQMDANSSCTRVANWQPMEKNNTLSGVRVALKYDKGFILFYFIFLTAVEQF